MTPQNRHKLEIFVHCITAGVLFLKGIDKISHHHAVAGAVLIALGILVLLLTFFGSRVGITHHTATKITYLIESFALCIVFALFLNDGKRFLPYIYLLAAALYMAAFLISLKKSRHH